MKQKKMGFTLIELLAVIVILAVIALIATPIIMNVIKDAGDGALQETARGYIKAIELSISKSSLKNETMIGDYQVNPKGNLIKNDKEIVVDVKGKKPTNGMVSINKDGRIAVSFTIENQCLVKKINSDKISILNDGVACKDGYATNLVRNGYLELGNNSNFKSFSYHEDQYLTRTTLNVPNPYNPFLSSDDYIMVDPTKKYFQSVDMKTDNTNAMYYAGLVEYDVDHQLIWNYFVNFIPNTTTTLTKDLKDGDTVVYLNDISNFEDASNTSPLHLGFIIWNYKDGSGKVWPAETYSRNYYKDLYLYTGINKSNHTITLKKPWDKGFVKAGTSLSQSDSGTSYNYTLLASRITKDWKTYSKVISGQSNIGNNAFYYGTKYVRFLILDNYNALPNTTSFYRNFVFREVDE